jgi:thiol:disulfide interchange protein DsbD
VRLPLSDTSVPVESDVFDTFDPTIWTRLEALASDDTAFGLFGIEFNLADFSPVGTLAAAFVAGIIFNIVPCVLPVLPLKAISFYEVSQHHRGRTLLLGLSFGLGVTLVFVLLGLLLFAFKTMTWGEPFANPIFSGSVALVLGVMALYQFGFLTFAVPTRLYGITPRHDTVTGNILFGGLTAVLSTPCTFGLFAALLAWALKQPEWLAVTSVSVVGLGMASPYVLLSAFPEVARKFPRSGPISAIVKVATGFLVLAIALFFAKVALAPILPPAISGNSYWWVVYTPLAIACLYVAIQVGRLAGPFGTIITGLAAAACLVAATVVTIKLTNDPFETFDDSRLLAARDDGPVVVKFTADWCLNCKTIEARVFSDDDFVDELRRDGVTLLKADLTNQDALGWELLEELNPARAIPFTAVYLPNQTNPVKLSGIYSKTDLQDALN